MAASSLHLPVRRLVTSLPLSEEIFLRAANHAQRTLEKCVNVLFEHLIVTGDAEQRLTQSTVLKDGILLILFLN